MIGPFVSTTGIAYPDDLKLLKEVYDRICRARGITPDTPEAASLAQAAMSLFSSGIVDEVEIVTSLDEFLKRRTRQVSQ